jgi:hypothetical protein
MSREGGQAMLETIIVFPLLLIVILAMVQLADVLVATMAAHWAARLSARSVAVHLNDAQDPLPVAEAAALQVMAPYLPPAKGTANLEERLSPVFRWMLRSTLYLTGGLRPVAVTGHVRFDHGVESFDKARAYLRNGERGSAVVDVEIWYPLRVPIGNRFFADASVTTATVRRITAEGQFPVMHAPVKNE